MDFLKQFAWNKMAWPSGPLLKLKKIVSFKVSFGKIWVKNTMLYKILKIFLAIIPKFHRKFGIIWLFFLFWGFGLFWNCLWPKLTFLFFWTRQPCMLWWLQLAEVHLPYLSSTKNLNFSANRYKFEMYHILCEL